MLGILLALSVGPVAVTSTSRAQSGSCDDRDGDGYFAGPGCVVGPFDCNDQNAAVHPGATEVCNGWDDNCDGQIDEGCNRICPNCQQTRRVRVNTNASEGRIVAADRGWGVIFNDGVDGFPEVVTRLDLLGQEICPETTYTENVVTNQDLVWTGDEMASAWDHFGNSSSGYGLFIRRLGPWGKPTGDRITLTTDDAYHYQTIWNGYEFALLWAHPDGYLPYGEFFSRVSVDDGIIGSNTLIDLTEHFSDSIAWNGAGYGWAFGKTEPSNGHEEIYFRTLSADGSSAGLTLRLTDHSIFDSASWGSGPIIASKGPGQGYGIVWLDNRTGVRQLWFAIINPDGSMLTPPGNVQLTNTVKNIAQQYDLAWSGQEFMAVGTNTDATGAGVGKIIGIRVSATGEVLEVHNITAGNGDDEPRIAWNGRSYGLAVEQAPLVGNPNIDFVEVGCNCTTDADHDGILPCGGGDCDDNDPSVGTGKPEICNDGKDNNCDGLVDCNDPTCSQNGNPPGAIGNVRLAADKVTISWNSDNKASVYDVARGVLGDLRDMENFKWTDCFRSKISGTSTTDAQVPTAGTGYYYIVRGRAQTCLLGTWGSTLADGTLHGCP